MRPLSSREWGACGGRSTSSERSDGERDSLGAQQRGPRASGLDSTPVSPQDGMRSQQGRWGSRRQRWSYDGPQHGADTPRLLGGAAIALTLLPELAATTLA